ncbi:hypothetical protein ACYCI3_28390, partial [Escherichia coli]
MNPITLSEMSDEDEEVKIISSYEPQDDEIAIVFDSSKITGGNALDFFQFTKQSHSNVKVYGDSKEGANKQVISSQADSLIKISRIWADFFPANTSNQP